MWIGFSVASAAVACLISVRAWLLSARNAALLRALQEALTQSHNEWKASLSNSSPASVSERLSNVEETLEVLANRVKMQRVRNAATHAEESSRKSADALPDPYRDPDGWRNAVNARLARAKFGV